MTKEPIFVTKKDVKIAVENTLGEIVWATYTLNGVRVIGMSQLIGYLCDIALESIKAKYLKDEVLRLVDKYEFKKTESRKNLKFIKEQVLHEPKQT